MPHVHTVEAFPEVLEGIPTPAIFFAITGMDPGDDPGDGRSCVRATFEACVLVDANRRRAPLQASILAAQLTDLLRMQYWDLDFVEGTTAVRAMPDGSTPELVQCAAWAVQWQQTVYLGATDWPWSDEPPGVLELNLGDDVPGVRIGAQP